MISLRFSVFSMAVVAAVSCKARDGVGVSSQALAASDPSYTCAISANSGEDAATATLNYAVSSNFPGRVTKLGVRFEIGRLAGEGDASRVFVTAWDENTDAAASIKVPVGTTPIELELKYPNGTGNRAKAVCRVSNS